MRGHWGLGVGALLAWLAAAPGAAQALPALSAAKDPAVRSEVVRLARLALQASLDGRAHAKPDPKAWPALLRAPGGAFVTLSRHGATRLCWGSMSPREGMLGFDILTSAQRVAHWDLRQPPIRAHERRGLMATVAIVGRTWPLQDLRLYRPRSQGLWLHGRRGGAVLLPGEAATAAWAEARARASAGLRPHESARMDCFEAATIGPFEVEPK